MKKSLSMTFASGLLFALGLAVSGMTLPSKVIGFLDVAGDWDPSLAFVMLGAIAVHLPIAIAAKRPKQRPFLAERYHFPTNTRIESSLIVGAFMFGVGWGIAGFCPGPALVSLVTLAPTTLLFVAAMIVGMLSHSLWLERRPNAVVAKALLGH